MLCTRKQSKPDAQYVARIQDLDKHIAVLEKEMMPLQSKSAGIEEALKQLEQKILDIGGSKLLAQKSKVDGIKLRINLANDETTRAEVAKAKAEKDLQKLDAAIEANKESGAEMDEGLAELQEQLEEVTQTIAEIRSRMEEAQI